MSSSKREQAQMAKLVKKLSGQPLDTKKKNMYIESDKMDPPISEESSENIFKEMKKKPYVD
jgi:hypothetical protein